MCHVTLVLKKVCKLKTERCAVLSDVLCRVETTVSCGPLIITGAEMQNAVPRTPDTAPQTRPILTPQPTLPPPLALSVPATSGRVLPAGLTPQPTLSPLTLSVPATSGRELPARLTPQPTLSPLTPSVPATSGRVLAA